MMELTLSRVCMVMCGVILLGAVVSPVSSMLNSSSDLDAQTLTDDFARMIDKFDDSGSDELVLELNNLIPVGSEIEFDGNRITVHIGSNTFRSYCKASLESAVFPSGDVISLTRSDGTIHFEKVS